MVREFAKHVVKGMPGERGSPVSYTEALGGAILDRRSLESVLLVYGFLRLPSPKAISTIACVRFLGSELLVLALHLLQLMHARVQGLGYTVKHQGRALKDCKDCYLNPKPTLNPQP